MGGVKAKYLYIEAYIILIQYSIKKTKKSIKMAKLGRPKRWGSLNIDQRTDRTGYNHSYYLLTKSHGTLTKAPKTHTKAPKKSKKESNHQYYLEHIKPFRKSKLQIDSNGNFIPTLSKGAWGKCPFCSTIRPVEALNRPAAIEIRAVAFAGRGKIIHTSGDMLRTQIPFLYDKAYLEFKATILNRCVTLLKTHYSKQQLQKLFDLPQIASTPSDYGIDTQSTYEGSTPSTYEVSTPSTYEGSA